LRRIDQLGELDQKTYITDEINFYFYFASTQKQKLAFYMLKVAINKIFKPNDSVHKDPLKIS